MCRCEETVPPLTIMMVMLSMLVVTNCAQKTHFLRTRSDHPSGLLNLHTGQAPPLSGRVLRQPLALVFLRVVLWLLQAEPADEEYDGLYGEPSEPAHGLAQGERLDHPPLPAVAVLEYQVADEAHDGGKHDSATQTAPLRPLDNRCCRWKPRIERGKLVQEDPRYTVWDRHKEVGCCHMQAARAVVEPVCDRRCWHNRQRERHQDHLDPLPLRPGMVGVAEHHAEERMPVQDEVDVVHEAVRRPPPICRSKVPLQPLVVAGVSVNAHLTSAAPELHVVGLGIGVLVPAGLPLVQGLSDVVKNLRHGALAVKRSRP
mmetsp:Transcript_39701/g.123730  ORF Transcript_39701/g.123730 Transcript_39701/m.123730 type:complete len:315 (+) Transcript_39701:123-1067(+)